MRKNQETHGSNGKYVTQWRNSEKERKIKQESRKYEIIKCSTELEGESVGRDGASQWAYNKRQ